MDVDNLWMHIETDQHVKILLGVIYRHPKGIISLGSGHKVSPGWDRRKLGGPPNFFRPIRGATKFFWNH